ncbi:hypothetical protein EB815_21520 [Mesorhizobium loti]|nr:hypothetical protein EB815_21520 [Mesorhizobium loti]
MRLIKSRSCLSQFPWENRFALFLELLVFSLSQFRTENRFALFLELLLFRMSWSGGTPGSFAGRRNRYPPGSAVRR